MHEEKNETQVLESDLPKDDHSGEWQSQIQKQLSAWNPNLTFQEMAAGGYILVNWVLTLTKPYEIKPLHKFVNLKFDCSSYISPFYASSKVENKKEHFHLSEIVFKNDKIYLSLAFNSDMSQVSLRTIYLQARVNYCSNSESNFWVQLVWSFLPYTSWVLTELKTWDILQNLFVATDSHWLSQLIALFSHWDGWQPED